MENEFFRFDILGTSFSIKSRDNTEDLSEIAEYLRSKIDEVTEESHLSDSLKISLLTSLNLVDELFKIKRVLHQKNNKEQASPDTIEAERITKALLRRVEESLQGHGPAIVHE
jgi:cell division protein ZapA (FtsZ GTPase activity inhibitor)